MPGFPDRFEQEAIDFHEKICAGYLQRAEDEPKRFICIDASNTLETVATDVIGALENILMQHLAKAGKDGVLK